MEFKADLHCHSTFSDGTLEPEKILLLAKEKELKGISITDHDTIAAYGDQKIFEKADKLNLILISGVEISGALYDETIHILGYNFDLASASLNSFLTELQIKKEQRNMEIISKLNRLGFKLTKEELYDYFFKKNIHSTIIGRPHIAELLVLKGYVTNQQEAFDKYLKDSGSCFAMGEKHLPHQIIEKIHLAKGKAVLAHPSQIKSAKVIKELKKMPFDGIEAYYSKLLLHQEKPWIDLAKQKGWIITGGSDFHGKVRPFIDLGCSWTPEEEFKKLIS